MSNRRRGASDPKVLSFLIIIGGFIGVFALYALEPWLIPPPPPPATKPGVAADAMKPDEAQEMLRYVKAEVAAFEGALVNIDAAFNGPADDLYAQLTPSGDGFSCGRIDSGRDILQEHGARFTYIRDWLKENARRAPDAETKGQFMRLLGEVDSAVKLCNHAILGFQGYQTATFQKAAESALKKLAATWRGFAESRKRLSGMAEKL